MADETIRWGFFFDRVYSVDSNVMVIFLCGCD